MKTLHISYGIGGKTLKWINSFLCFRQQRVVIHGVKSDWAPFFRVSSRAPVLASFCSRYIESEIRLLAGDCVCYREIKDEEGTMKLQMDIDRLGCWARKWGMRFR